ncbi:BglII/BstYI family type II restriction endonuclease [Calidithermus roseus]|uniref:BglII/BstYI family type II restriction endonuclease n=1 Tax=Calidithermus roseus TaxID=1644118 RepID=UPI001C70D4B1
MALDLLPPYVHEHYEVHEWKHASAILKTDFPSEWNDIVELLLQFKLCKSWITDAGGNRSKVSRAIDGFLYSRGWVEKQFNTSVIVDEVELSSPTHQVDCYKNRVALEHRVEQ